MKSILQLLAIVFTISVTAQTPELGWANRMGSVSSDRGEALTVDVSGNVYVAGVFEGTVDFDPGESNFNLTSNGDFDLFIQKLDADGNLIWAKSIGGSGRDWARAISTDNSGNVFITGYFRETVDFNPNDGIFNLTSNGNNDIFILKLNSDGEFVWAKSMGSPESDEGLSIATDSSGNILISGYFSGTVDFDPGDGAYNLTSEGEDIFIQKLDADGNLIWVKNMGNGNFFNLARSLTLDESGNIYTTGYFTGTIDFDPGDGVYNLTSEGGGLSVFIQKLDTNGNFVWARKVGSNTNYTDSGKSIAVDQSENVYVTGSFQQTVDFDPGDGVFNLSSVGLPDIFVLKLNADGSFAWAKRMGGSDVDEGFSISVDASGDVYTTGMYYGTVDFDPGSGVHNLNGERSIFTQKLNTDGEFVWAVGLGGNDGFGWGFSSALDADGNIYTTGIFGGTLDFDPNTGIFNLTSAGGNDVFVRKLNQPTMGIEENEINQITLYPNPAKDHFTISNLDPNSQIKIVDLTGKVVKEIKTISSDQTLSVKGWNSGVYFVQIQSEKNSIVRKLIVKK